MSPLLCRSAGVIRCFGACGQDFWQMVVHHISTVSLMVMSWTANMVRVGTLVLCVHDAVDYLLEVRPGTLVSVAGYDGLYARPSCYGVCMGLAISCSGSLSK